MGLNAEQKPRKTGPFMIVSEYVEPGQDDALLLLFAVINMTMLLNAQQTPLPLFLWVTCFLNFSAIRAYCNILIHIFAVFECPATKPSSALIFTNWI